MASSILIVAASRGLGLGLARTYLARGWQVVATVRGETQGELHTLAQENPGRLSVEQLDINEPEQIAALKDRLSGRRFDVLFVNAGIANDPSMTIGEISTDEFIRLMVTNALSPMRVIEALEPLVSAHGTVAAMSSGLGSVAGNTSGGFEIYRASKAALNTLLRSFAVRDKNRSRTVLAVSPGWVRTDMGGDDAPLDVETSCIGMAEMIDAEPQPGARFIDYQGKTVEW